MHGEDAVGEVREVEDTEDAHARLRALAASERRMGLSKTSWEEQDRQAALSYLQQDRDKARQAALAAEQRFRRSSTRGKPASASATPSPLLAHCAPGPAHAERNKSAPAGSGLLTLHECLSAVGLLDKGSGDCCHVDGDALVRIAEMAAAVRVGLADGDRRLLGGHGQEEEGTASIDQDGNGEMECDVSDIPDGASVGSHGNQSDVTSASLLRSMQDGGEEEEDDSADELEQLTTPQRLGRIRSVALGILLGGERPSRVQVGAEGDVVGSEAEGDELQAKDESKYGEGHGTEEARLWLEQAQVGAPALLASVVDVRVCVRARV